MAYCCEECGVIFEEAEERRHHERSGEELDPPSYHCPECGSEFYEEVEYCCLCQSHLPLSEMDGDICEDCMEKLREKVRAALIDGRRFNSLEVAIIKEKIELGDIFEC